MKTKLYNSKKSTENTHLRHSPNDAIMEQARHLSAFPGTTKKLFKNIFFPFLFEVFPTNKIENSNFPSLFENFILYLIKSQ